MWTEVYSALLPDNLHLAKMMVSVALLTLFWCWETWRPFFGQLHGRYGHAARNLTVALFNTLVLGLTFGFITARIAGWTEASRFGLLQNLPLVALLRFALALVILDGWMYVWHRANHLVPLLWRFHRMHHSDRHVDVTTATRFHVGEHIGAALARLVLIPLLGFDVWNLVIYDALVIAVTQFHHADISLGRLDHWLRFVIVTPDMHKIHHSDHRPETDSNFSTVFSFWDRLAGSFRMRPDLKTVVFGLDEFREPAWQSLLGMIKTPFVDPHAHTLRLLFICNENCNRSQMAKAFADMYGAGRLEVYTAGYHPAASIDAKAIAAMKELSYEFDQRTPQSVRDLPDLEYDVAVSMCDDTWPELRARKKEQWNIPVPKLMPPAEFRTVLEATTVAERGRVKYDILVKQFAKEV